MKLDHAIVAVVSGLAIALHVVLFVLIRRWMDRDLVLSFAGDDPGKRAWMLGQLAQAKRERVARRASPAGLEQQAATWRPDP